MKTQIAVVNQSSVVDDAGLQAAIPSFQKQIDQDLGRYWACAYGCYLQFFPKDSIDKIPADAWQIVVLDNADMAGALGYHDVTKTGMPLAKVFAKTSQNDVVNWSTVFSHEMCEMIVDPQINQCFITARVERVGRGMVVATEVGDPVEAESYSIDGIAVSNFVTPAWFYNFTPENLRYDFLGNLKAPFTLSKGGYFSYLSVIGWGSKGADKDKVSSRLERRIKGIENWIRSIL